MPSIQSIECFYPVNSRSTTSYHVLVNVTTVQSSLNNPLPSSWLKKLNWFQRRTTTTTLRWNLKKRKHSSKSLNCGSKFSNYTKSCCASKKNPNPASVPSSAHLERDDDDDENNGTDDRLGQLVALWCHSALQALVFRRCVANAYGRWPMNWLLPLVTTSLHFGRVLSRSYAIMRLEKRSVQIHWLGRKSWNFAGKKRAKSS